MQDNPTRRRQRLLKAVLVLSLALNLLVLGAIGGALWRFGGHGHAGKDGGAGARTYAAPYLQALPREQRRELHRKMRAERPRQSAEERQAAYAQMLAALRAEPFDRAAAEAVLEAQGRAAQEGLKNAHALWLTQVSQMDAAARRAYADALAARLAERSKRRRDR